jgi:metallothionein
MTTVTQMKCACKPCLCIVSLTDAIMKDGQAYCGEGCASGHAAGQGCGQTGCGCDK